MNAQHHLNWYVTATIAVMGAGLCSSQASAQSGPPVDRQQGVEILTRGPIHEAFAETITFNPEPGIIVSTTPPEIIEELPPDERPEGFNVSWIPGYWAWDDERNDFLWLSGIWRELPPGRQWVPGYWGSTNRGFQWISGYWADADVDEIAYLPQPPESLENGPNIAQPAPNLGWVPGSWIWVQSRYAWRPGYWAAGRQDWDWIPAHYIWAPRGYVFSDGYWDYAAERRGVLFAPVYLEKQVYTRREFSYSPSFAINLAVFSDQLFLRPRYQHYYFGDYYDTRYQDSGYVASFSYQSSHRGYDPIYARRSWEHRRVRNWEHRDRDTFEHRRKFVDARPPRTLRAQRDSVGRGGRPGETRIEVAASFSSLAKRKDGAVRFQKIDNTERQQLGRRGQAIQNTRRERQKLDNGLSGAESQRRSKSNESIRAKLPNPLIVAKPIDQRGAGQAPPKRHRVPELAPDSKSHGGDSRKNSKKDREPKEKHKK